MQLGHGARTLYTTEAIVFNAGVYLKGKATDVIGIHITLTYILDTILHCFNC